MIRSGLKSKPIKSNYFVDIVKLKRQERLVENLSKLGKLQYFEILNVECNSYVQKHVNFIITCIIQKHIVSLLQAELLSKQKGITSSSIYHFWLNTHSLNIFSRSKCCCRYCLGILSIKNQNRKFFPHSLQCASDSAVYKRDELLD